MANPTKNEGSARFVVPALTVPAAGRRGVRAENPPSGPQLGRTPSRARRRRWVVSHVVAPPVGLVPTRAGTRDVRDPGDLPVDAEFPVYTRG